MDGQMEFVCAIVKDADGHYIPVTVPLDGWMVPEKPATSGEVEYIVNRVAYDMQSRRLVEEITKSQHTDERKATASRINKALKARRAQA
jgi:hypothetical protein